MYSFPTRISPLNERTTRQAAVHPELQGVDEKVQAAVKGLSLSICRNQPTASVRTFSPLRFLWWTSLLMGARAQSTTPFPASMTLSALTGIDGFVLNGEARDDQSGYSVASAGDVNGDGIADLLIGA